MNKNEYWTIFECIIPLKKRQEKLRSQINKLSPILAERCEVLKINKDELKALEIVIKESKNKSHSIIKSNIPNLNDVLINRKEHVKNVIPKLEKEIEELTKILTNNNNELHATETIIRIYEQEETHNKMIKSEVRELELFEVNT